MSTSGTTPKPDHAKPSGPADPFDNAEVPFFIGWADAGRLDRRFFLRAGLGLMAGTAALAAALAALQKAPGPGGWDQDTVGQWTGIVTAEPYAMLRTLDFGQGPTTALLACEGKCGVAARLGALAGQRVTISGTLIQRGPHRMIAVNEQGEWIQAAAAAAPAATSSATVPSASPSNAESPSPPAATLTAAADLQWPAAEPLGTLSLVGEILDSKCWFGAMRPSEGKVHKACASLCIRGGLPPAFFALGDEGRGALLIMTSGGRAHGADLLPLVADAVSIRGQVFRRGDLLFLDAPVSAIQRVA